MPRHAAYPDDPANAAASPRRSAARGTGERSGASVSGAPVVRFEGVGMRYGRAPEVLKDINLSLAPGSFHFLTGASGAGKSSLLKLIYLAHRPSRGVIRLFGRDIATPRRPALPSM